MAEETPQNLVEFNELVEDAYQQEISILTLRGESLPSRLSVQDLQIKRGKNNLRPATSRMDVIDSWRGLLARVKDSSAFTEYVSPMEKSFLDVEDIPKEEYRRLKTLVDLLAQTVKNHDRDDSIECRFVTLLEVMLSYSEDWEPSEAVVRIWNRINHDVPVDIAPASFRRRAYRVIVSLSWVPSTNGLLDACSFDESKQKTDYAQAPYALQQEVFWKIRASEPRPRYESVNMILDRLKDETDVCVAIWSDREGMGKSTLAAQVASNPSILKVFTVLWLRAGKSEHRGPLTYQKYVEYLNQLSTQLSVKREWDEQADRIEEPAIQALREKSLMVQARENMSALLDDEGLNVLLIIDDLEEASWIEWFRFNEHQSMIVTTPQSDLAGVDWSVHLEAMSEGEAIELFLLEANLPKDHILGNTMEVREVVKKCECNPLTVRSVARWFHLKQVTSGVVKAMEEVLTDLETLENSERQNKNDDETDEDLDPNMFVFDVLSLMMGPTRNDTHATSVLFVMCFASLVVVFPRRVPLDAVLLLWEQVLQTEPHAIEELYSNGALKPGVSLLKHAWFIAEGLIHMGVIHVFDDEVGDPWIQIHHKLYSEFGTLMAREMDLKEKYEQSLIDWNVAFVTTYFSKRIQALDVKVANNSWEYALTKMPRHMMTGKMFPTTENVLSEEHFLKARIEAMGWEKAIKLQLSDCVAFQTLVEYGHKSVSPVFSRFLALLQEQALVHLDPDNKEKEIARILLKLGFIHARLGFYSEATGYFAQAEQLLPTEDPSFASCLYGEGVCNLQENSERGLEKIKECHQVMEAETELHYLYTDMLLAVALGLVAACQYKEAAQFYKVICDKFQADANDWKLELGNALYGQARLSFIMNDFEAAKDFFIGTLKRKEDTGEKGRDLANAYAYLGDALVELNQAGKAKEQYDNTLDVLNEIGEGDGTEFRLVTGKVLFLKGNYYGSSDEFEAVLNSVRNQPVRLLDKTAYDIRCIARTYHTRGESGKAIELLQESLALTDTRLLSMERASCLSDLGHLLIETGDSSEGLTFLEQALEIQYRHLGEGVTFVDNLKSIGNVHRSLRAYDEAMAVYYRVRDVLLRAHSNDADRMADILFVMGDVLDLKEETEEAIDSFKSCINLLEKNSGGDHPAIGKALHRLGVIAWKGEDYEKAEEHFTKAYAIAKIHNQELTLAAVSHYLGVLARRKGDLALAHDHLMSALEVRKVHDNAEETAQTLLEIGNIYRMQLEFDSALSVYDKAQETLKDDDELFHRVNYGRGHACVSKGEADKAVPFFTKMLELTLDKLGRDHMMSGKVSRSLGLAYFLLNNREKARLHLNEFVRLCEQQDDEETCETMDYAMTVFLLGDLYKLNNKMEQAEAVWTVAKEVCEDNDFTKTYPGFFGMVSTRLESGAEAKPKTTGLMAMFTGDSQIMSDSKERKILEEIVFVDE